MSTSGGTAWNRINGDSIKYGYVVSAGSALYQVGAWWDNQGKPRMAIVRSPSDTGPWTRSIICNDSSEARAFAVHPAQPGVLYAGGYVGLSESQWATHYACLYKSTNSGASWTRLAGTVFTTTPECVYGICIDPSNTNRVIAVTDLGAYRSTNGGTSWSIPVQAFGGKCILADPNVPGRFYAGAKDGVYESTDGGSTWTNISKGLPGKAVTSIAYDPVGWRLYAGTSGGGIFRLALPTDVAGEPGPATFSLEQNYPNPFNPLTTIHFSIGNTQFTTLNVFDLLGREVALLVNEERGPGSYTVRFDASALSSGMYLYRLRAGDNVRTKRMLVIR